MWEIQIIQTKDNQAIKKNTDTILILVLEFEKRLSYI